MKLCRFFPILKFLLNRSDPSPRDILSRSALDTGIGTSHTWFGLDVGGGGGGGGENFEGIIKKSGALVGIGGDGAPAGGGGGGGDCLGGVLFCPGIRFGTVGAAAVRVGAAGRPKS